MTTEQLRRAAFLQEMDVGAIWLRRNPVPVADSGLTEEAASVAEAVQTGDIVAALALAPAAAAAPGVDLSVVSPAVLPASAAHSSPVAAASSSASASASTSPSAAWDDTPLAIDPATLPPVAEIALMDWQQLEAAVAACRGCDLCQRRNQTVFGSGDRQAKWLFVGEGPGRTEDQQGAPFVGPAGKLLDSMLAAMDLRRDANVYLANIVKCRSTDAKGIDHAPTPQQSALCQPYLERQIALLQPTVIVALGKTAALALLGCAPGTSLSSLRGQVHQVQQRPLVVTYHPAYLLRKPIAKRETWDDLCLALRTYSEKIVG
jgi:DNA polymerase